MNSAGFSRVQAMANKVSAAEALEPAMSSDLLPVTPTRCRPTLCSVVKLCQLSLRAAKSPAQLEDTTAFARE